MSIAILPEIDRVNWVIYDDCRVCGELECVCNDQEEWVPRWEDREDYCGFDAE